MTLLAHILAENTYSESLNMQKEKNKNKRRIIMVKCILYGKVHLNYQ